MITRVTFLLLLIADVAVVAQDTKADTTFVTTSIAASVKTYAAAMEGQSRLYNGTGYTVYESLQKNEHPYFLVDDWTSANLRYDGEDYKNIPIMYDIFRDKVIIEHYYHHELIELISERLLTFSLANHTFVHLNRDPKNNVKEGFYDLVYDGKTKIYIRYEKTMQKTVKNKVVTYFFDYKSQVYINKNGEFFPVSTKSSVLSVFSDHERDLKQFLIKNKIRFNSGHERAIIQMADFYDTLID